ncbi:MAG: hypothetical protein IT518_23120 [Burkholderiales bacterium]|nr:hypothetical protein [Burkholderiales bacterium]
MSGTTLAGLDADIARFVPQGDAAAAAARLLALAERVLEQWVVARGEVPTNAEREGFRLLALHRQGAQDEPGFNACRETCREIAYHYNLLLHEPTHVEAARRQAMMALLVRHLSLFVSGRLEVARLGDFCCASRPRRTAAEDDVRPGVS